MTVITNKLVVPTLRYNYVHVDSSGAPVTPNVFRPDEIDLDVPDTAAVDSQIEAKVTLRAFSSSVSFPSVGSNALTHVRVVVTAPRCDIGPMSVSLKEFGYTSEVIDQSALFRQPRARVGKPYAFTVKLTPQATGTLRLVFGVQAAELTRPLLLYHDLVVT